MLGQVMMGVVEGDGRNEVWDVILMEELIEFVDELDQDMREGEIWNLGGQD